MKVSTSNIIALLALAATNVVAAPATGGVSVDVASDATASSQPDFANLGEESLDDDYSGEPFELSELLPELFPELVARAKPGCMGGSWRACHDWTLRQCPLRCTGLPRRRHPCTQRCIRGADIQCQKACS